MADDILFDLLHSEIINYALNQPNDNDDNKQVHILGEFHLPVVVQ